MNRYKHYSFDLWLTLIKSNPEFKIKRAEYFHKHFNALNLTLEEVDTIIRGVDVTCNITNEIVGRNIDSYEMYTMVLYRLGYNLSNLSYRDIQSIYHVVESIFFQYPPILYDENTKEVLQRLAYNGATISILSNTGFIKGYTLRKLMDDLKISDLFSFKIFSDEVGTSKPNNQLFMMMISAVNRLRAHNPISTQEIIHIGDNERADFNGAVSSGINAMLINSFDKKIKDVL